MKKFSLLFLCLLLSGSVSTPILWEAAIKVALPIFSPTHPESIHIPDSTVSSSADLEIIAPVIPSAPTIERVLIISYDGMRPDAIAAAPMNTLLELMNTSAYTLTNAITIAYPSTLPSHAAMLSGLCMAKNGINYDRYFKYMGYSKGVDIFDLAHAAGMRTVMIVGKDKLRQLAEPETTDVFELRYDEATIAKEAVAQISQGFGLMFVHFPTPDKVGHKFEWMGGSYLKVLRDGDEALAEILAALDENGLRETTLIIVTADHGGHDKNHVGLVIADFLIPWIASGPGIIPGEITASLQTMDTAATVALALGFPLQEDWEGIPVYEAFGQPRLKIHPESVQWPCHQWN
jgi:hypothetical protein